LLPIGFNPILGKQSLNQEKYQKKSGAEGP